MSDPFKKQGLLILLIFLFITPVTIVSAANSTNTNSLYLFSAASNGYSYEVQTTSDNNIIFFNNLEGTVPWSHNVGRKINAIAISSDGKYVVVSCEDGLYFLFTNKGEIVWKRTIPSAAIKSISISKDNAFIDLTTVNNQVFYLTISGNQIDGSTRGINQVVSEPTTPPTEVPTTIPTPLPTPSPTVPSPTTSTKKPVQDNNSTPITQNFFVWGIVGIIVLYVVKRLMTEKNKKTSMSRISYPPQADKKLQEKKKPSGNSKTVQIETPSYENLQISKSKKTEKTPSRLPLDDPQISIKILTVSHSSPPPPVLVKDSSPIHEGERLPPRNIAEASGSVKLTINPDAKNIIDESLFESDERNDIESPVLIPPTIKPKPVIIVKDESAAKKSQLPEKEPLKSIVNEIDAQPLVIQNQIDDKCVPDKEKIEDAKDLLKNGNGDESLPSPEKAIDLDPEYANVWYSRGITLSETGNYEDAIFAFEKAIAINPKLTGAHFSRGVALSKLGRKNDAVASYNKTIAITPDYADALYNLGEIQIALGQFSNAISSLDKYVKIRKENVHAWYLRGIAFDNLGKFTDAILSFNKAIEIDPQFIDAYLNRGYAQNSLKQYSEAIASFDKILEITPDNAAVLHIRRITSDNLKKNSGADKSVDKIIEIKPSDSDALYNRGIALEESGGVNTALESDEKALSFNPESAAIQKSRNDVLLTLPQKEESAKLSKTKKGAISRWNAPDADVIVIPDVEETRPKPVERSHDTDDGPLRLDRKKLDKIRDDTYKVKAILGEIFDTDEGYEAPSQNESTPTTIETESSTDKYPEKCNLPFPEEALSNLESKYYPLLIKICHRTEISKDELKQIIRESHLMYEATITDINTWADEFLDDFLLEEEPEENRIKINTKGINIPE